MIVATIKYTNKYISERRYFLKNAAHREFRILFYKKATYFYLFAFLTPVLNQTQNAVTTEEF